MEASLYRQPPFYRVFAGQLILLACAATAAVLISRLFGLSIVSLVAIAFVMLALVSIVGPARSIAAEVRLDADGIKAKRYIGEPWTSAWSDLTCVGEFELATFGTLRRLRLESRTGGTIYVSDLMPNFDDLVQRVRTLGPSEIPPCPRLGLIARLLTGG
jgi:hypothetical protein